MYSQAKIKQKILLGTSGNDTLYGYATNDILDGGSGIDTLSGGAGSDTYHFGLGYGQDLINNFDTDAIGVNPDKVLLGSGITTTGITLNRNSYDDLIIKVNGTTDQFTINDYFYLDGNSSHGLETIQFADGTVYSQAKIKQKILLPTSGDDTLYGYATNDLLEGGAGNDTLSGAAGNDTLDGGAGNDRLLGQVGADIYKFGLGSGQDTIDNYDSDGLNINSDKVLFGSGIAHDQLWLTKSNGNLNIQVIGTSNTVSIERWDYGNESKVEQFQTASGKLMLHSQVDALVNAMAAFTPPTAGQTTLPPDYQTALNSIITSSWK